MGRPARRDALLHGRVRRPGLHLAAGRLPERRQGSPRLQPPHRLRSRRRRPRAPPRRRRLRGVRRRPARDHRRGARARARAWRPDRGARGGPPSRRAAYHPAGPRHLPRRPERAAPAVKLTILTQYYPPEVGAPQGRLSGLAAAFQRRGHAVTVLTAMPNYPTGRVYPGYGGVLRREVRDGVRVIRTFVFPTQKADFLRRLSSYFSFVFASAAVGTVFLERPDYLIVESPPLFLGLAGAWLSWVKRCRMIFNVSDLWPESAVRLGVLRPEGLAYRLSGWLERFCYRRAALVTGQTRAIVGDIAARFPWCRTYHLSNGVNDRVFPPDRRTAEARAALGPTDACIAFYAGLHGLAQVLDRVLDAAAVLADTPLRFVLMGDGPTKADLVRQAWERGLNNVDFLDARPTSEVPPLLAAADVVVVPLVTHLPGATPSKLYEAMASGRPVVLVAEGEPATIVREQEAGLVVAPGDIGGLSGALRTLSHDPNLRRALGGNGRRAAERLFNQVEIDARFVAFLEQRHELARAVHAPPSPATRGEAI